MEFGRLATLHRVYTQSHIDSIAEALIEVYERRDTLCGLRMIDGPVG